MSRHTLDDAMQELPDLVHAAERGERVEITRDGRPVAVLLSFAEFSRRSDARPDLWDPPTAFRILPGLSELDEGSVFHGSRVYEYVRHRTDGHA
jgi:prevent-host-death family protein